MLLDVAECPTLVGNLCFKATNHWVNHSSTYIRTMWELMVLLPRLIIGQSATGEMWYRGEIIWVNDVAPIKATALSSTFCQAIFLKVVVPHPINILQL